MLIGRYHRFIWFGIRAQAEEKSKKTFQSIFFIAKLESDDFGIRRIIIGLFWTDQLNNWRPD
jgi:hypothetical protein